MRRERFSIVEDDTNETNVLQSFSGKGGESMYDKVRPIEVWVKPDNVWRLHAAPLSA
jgi:hypothetical protein